MPTLFEKIKGMKKYEIAVSCENCGLKHKMNVPKGISVREFAQSGEAKCKNCGCEIIIKEYSTQWLK